MGDFIGHMSEASVFYILCLWWSYKGFSNYIKASLGHGKYKMEVSYISEIRGRKIPFEQILKVVFSCVGAIGELIINGIHFTDENGQAAENAIIMHVSIYTLFFLHSIVDLLVRYKAPFVLPKMDFWSGGLAFLWYGLGFFYHAHKDHAELENSLHLFLSKPVFVISLTLFAAIIWQDSILLDFTRCFCLGLLATWTTHIAFLLYEPGFPGRQQNKNLILTHTGNIHRVPVTFGLHLILNFVFMMLLYGFCHFLVTIRCRHKIKYVNLKDEDETLSEKLIANGH